MSNKITSNPAKKRVTSILNTIYGLIVLLFLLDKLTCFDIKDPMLKSSVYFGFLIGTPVMLLWNLFSKRWLLIVYPILLLILVFVMEPLRIIFQSTAWETKAVLYEHKSKSYKTVEHQWQDVGALGWNRREVEVTYLTPLFMITGNVPSNINENPDWIENNEPTVID